MRDFNYDRIEAILRATCPPPGVLYGDLQYKDRVFYLAARIYGCRSSAFKRLQPIDISTRALRFLSAERDMPEWGTALFASWLNYSVSMLSNWVAFRAMMDVMISPIHMLGKPEPTPDGMRYTITGNEFDILSSGLGSVRQASLSNRPWHHQFNVMSGGVFEFLSAEADKRRRILEEVFAHWIKFTHPGGLAGNQEKVLQ